MTKKISVHINLIGKAMIHSFIKSFIGCTALLLYMSGFSQSPQVKNNVKTPIEMGVSQSLTSNQVAALSRAYQDKALWFKEMPHFNRDSTVFYFNMATQLLQNSQPLQYERLAYLYRDITDRANRSHNFNVVDSLAPIGWAYYEKIPESKKDKVLGYDLLINWALIKIVRGEPKPGLELFVKAQDLVKDDLRPEIRLKLLKDKGRFLYQYGLPEEQEQSFQFMSESMKGYRNSNYAEKNEALMTTYKTLYYHYTDANSDSSVYYMDQIAALLPKITNPFHHTWYYYAMGSKLIDKENYDQAKPYLYKTIKLLEENNLRTIDVYQFAHSRLGDIAKAEGSYDGHSLLRKSQKLLH